MDARTIRFRPGWRQLPWYLFVYPLGQALLATSDGASLPMAALLAAVVLVIAGEIAWLRTTGVELTPDALVARGIRTRVVPWRDVWWIGPYPQLGTQCVGVRTKDDLFRLRAPIHMRFLAPDPGFDAKAHAIHDWWVARRGADWQPPPPSPWWPPAT